jgi:hypothetical protein
LTASLATILDAVGKRELLALTAIGEVWGVRGE